jgi:hypothetical protein
LAKCAAITQAGTACKGTPIDGSSYCCVHHPDYTEERRRYGSKGGRRGGRGRPQAELGAIKARLLSLADDVLAGNVERGDVAVVGQLLNTVIRAISVELEVREQLELVGRLEALEETLEDRRVVEERYYGA